MAKVKRSSSTPNQVFISHNKADKDFARSLALALTDEGIGVWFDEWDLKPGDSITGGIDSGLSAADMVVLVWSKHAAKSRWVKAELQASIYRRITDGTIRVVPVRLDETPLPPLVADLFAIRAQGPHGALEVAAKIVG